MPKGTPQPIIERLNAAVNKVQRGPAWTNKPVVTVVEPGRAFAFARTEKFGGTVEWTYRFEPDGGRAITMSPFPFDGGEQQFSLLRRVLPHKSWSDGAVFRSELFEVEPEQTVLTIRAVVKARARAKR